MNVNQQIRAAVSQHWPEFAREHPRLAEALDEQIVIEQIADELADDPEYRRALARADAAIAVQAVIKSIVMSDPTARGIARNLQNFIREASILGYFVPSGSIRPCR